MPTTPVYALRYPVSTDTPDVPRDIGNLAADVDAALGPKPATGLVSGECEVWNGSAWVRSSVTKIGSGSLAAYPWKNADIDPAAAIALSKLAGYPSDGTMFAAGDGTWKAPAVIPAGAMLAYGGAAAPAGWLLCDGAAVSRTTYAALYAALGVAYGAGDGSSTFNLPDLRGNFPVGKDTGTFAVLGATGGEETHALTVAELASHAHTFAGTALPGHAHAFTGSALPGHGHSFSGAALPAHTHRADFRYTANGRRDGTNNAMIDIQGSLGESGGFASYFYTANPTTSPAVSGTINSVSAGTPAGSINSVSAGTPAGTISSVGSGAAHNNLPPFQVVNYIIKT